MTLPPPGPPNELDRDAPIPMWPSVLFLIALAVFFVVVLVMT